jgi:hypothetical protein
MANRWPQRGRGGWLWSPQGGHTADPALTGDANFGFVSKYKKGTNVPTGNTGFRFKASNLNFHSSSYDWLVVAGANAKYKGLAPSTAAATTASC